jgi:hypothetical protein
MRKRPPSRELRRSSLAFDAAINFVECCATTDRRRVVRDDNQYGKEFAGCPELSTSPIVLQSDQIPKINMLGFLR